jgi:hypothetical protein
VPTVDTTYFRLRIIGYFEGIDGERGIVWRIADSLALRRFAGIALAESTPDHSTLSRNRRLIDLETHQEVFTWMVQSLAKHKGERVQPWLDALPTTHQPRPPKRRINPLGQRHNGARTKNSPP